MNIAVINVSLPDKLLFIQIMKSFIIKSFAAICIIATVVSCNKSSKTAVLAISMTDQPVDFDSVNVEITDVQIHFSQGDSANPSDWASLATNAGVYNLLELQNGVTAALTNPDDIPVGKLQQMRLILGSNNYVVIDSVVHPLEISSQDKTGIKINLKTEVTANDSIEILIDFDASQSIIEKGTGQFMLKPVIKVEDIIFF